MIFVSVGVGVVAVLVAVGVYSSWKSETAKKEEKKKRANSRYVNVFLTCEVPAEHGLRSANHLVDPDLQRP